MLGKLPKPGLFRGGLKRNLNAAFWLLPAVFSIPVHAAAQSDLTAVSLESLMEVEVTSAAKKPQQLHDTTTAIYVISGEDIRRSGVTTLAEALRLAPGVDVARATNNQWSVTIRGLPFNKLLVLIDGRIIYSLLNAGVFWNQHDALLSDIDRIEVIRGPGGTLWGANAVINIMTKSAEDTQGGQWQIGAGSTGDVIGSLRYGGELGRDAHYRIYGKYSDHGSLELSDGSNARDDWQLGQFGGRLDWQATSRDTVTIQGDFFRNEFETLSFLPLTSFFQPLPAVDTTEQYGGNVLVRWERETDHAGRVSLQSYFDWLDAESIISTFDTKTWDVEFEHELPVHENVDLIWGLGYRLLSYDSEASLAIVPDPLGQELNWFTGFLQGDIDLTGSLRVTLGSKFEHNDISGFEYQPNLRLLWHPHEDHAVWASVSRAVRTPAPSDRRVRFNFAMLPGMAGSPPLLFSFLPNLDLESEELIAWELGYRPQIRNDLSLDVTAFYFDYDRLLAGIALPPVFETDPPPPHLLFGFQADNLMRGEIYGLEGMLQWRANEHWRMEASYAFKKLALHADDPAVLDMPGFGGPSDIEKSSPQQQFQIRSYLDLAHNIEADVSLFYVDRVPALNVEDYVRLDLHLGWRPLPELSLDLYARNLLEDNHTETSDLFGAASRIPRSVFGRVTWRW